MTTTKFLDICLKMKEKKSLNFYYSNLLLQGFKKKSEEEKRERKTD